MLEIGTRAILRPAITIENDDAIEVVVNETPVLEGNGGQTPAADRPRISAVVRGDLENEPDETLEIVVTYGDRVVGRGTVVIRDDDGPPLPPQQKRRTSRH